MCGIFGFQWSSKAPTKQQRRMVSSVLAAEMDHRGRDSWGWYSSDLQTFHRRGHGQLSLSNQAKEIAKRQSVIAHTRKATTGHVSKANCHPFALESIVGAHNGIVTNHEELNNAYQRKCTVDSQHIFHHIQENADLGEIEAWGAIAYQYRAIPGTVHLGRFNGGELSVSSTDYGIIFASTHNALARAVSLAGLGKRTDYQVDEGKEYIARDGILYLLTDKVLAFDKPHYEVMGFSHGCGAGTGWDSGSSDGVEYDELMEKWTPRNTYLEKMDREERDWKEAHGYYLGQ